MDSLSDTLAHMTLEDEPELWLIDKLAFMSCENFVLSNDMSFGPSRSMRARAAMVVSSSSGLVGCTWTSVWQWVTREPALRPVVWVSGRMTRQDARVFCRTVNMSVAWRAYSERGYQLLMVHVLLRSDVTVAAWTS